MNYWAYTRISTKDQIKHNIEFHGTPYIARFLKKHGYKTNDEVNQHIFAEHWTSKSTRFPRFKQLLDTAKRGDTLVFYQLSEMADSLSQAENFIQTYNRMHINIYVIKGHWSFSSKSTGTNMLKTLESINDFETNIINRQSEFQHAILQEYHSNFKHLNHFYDTQKSQNLAIFHYRQAHDTKTTAKHFHTTMPKVKSIFKHGIIYLQFELLIAKRIFNKLD